AGVFGFEPRPKGRQRPPKGRRPSDQAVQSIAASEGENRGVLRDLPEYSARLAQPLQRVLVAGLQAERALEGGARVGFAGELELAPADPVVEPVPVRPGPQGALEETERLVVSPEVVEAPGHLRAHVG